MLRRTFEGHFRDILGTRGTLEGHISCPGARKAPAEILTTPANFSCFVKHVDQLSHSQGKEWLRDISGTLGTLEGHISCPGARKAPAEILTTPANFSCFVKHVDQLSHSQGKEWLRDI